MMHTTKPLTSYTLLHYQLGHYPIVGSQRGLQTLKRNYVYIIVQFTVPQIIFWLI